MTLPDPGGSGSTGYSTTLSVVQDKVDIHNINISMNKIFFDELISLNGFIFPVSFLFFRYNPGRPVQKFAVFIFDLNPQVI
jgi:hypothetical protein